MKKLGFFVVVIILITFIIGYLLLQITKLNNLSLNQTPSQTADQKVPFIGIEKRLWKSETDEYQIYQFPVVVLGTLTDNDGLYRVKVSPYNEVTEELDLILGDTRDEMIYGNCEFSETGEITGNASWSKQMADKVFKTIKTADSLLVKIEIPKVANGDTHKSYLTYLQDVIKKLENKEKLDYLFPTSLCKQKI